MRNAQAEISKFEAKSNRKPLWQLRAEAELGDAFGENLTPKSLDSVECYDAENGFHGMATYGMVGWDETATYESVSANWEFGVYRQENDNGTSRWMRTAPTYRAKFNDSKLIASPIMTGELSSWLRTTEKAFGICDASNAEFDVNHAEGLYGVSFDWELSKGGKDREGAGGGLAHNPEITNPELYAKLSRTRFVSATIERAEALGKTEAEIAEILARIP